MSPKTVTRSASATRTPRSGVFAKAAQFLTLKHEGAALTARADVLKKELMAHVDQHGEVDAQGHKIVPLPTPLQIGGKEFTALKRERRVSTSFDEETAERILNDKGLYGEAVETIVVLDQDKIYLLNQIGKITDEELDSMFVQSESFAFKPVTA